MEEAADRCVRALAATFVTAFLASFALVACGSADDLIRNTIRLGDSAPAGLAQENLEQSRVLLDDLDLSSAYVTQPETGNRVLNALGETACISGDIASELPESSVVSGVASVDSGTGEVLGLVEMRPGYVPTSLPEGSAYFTIETDSISNVGETISFFCES